MFWKFFSVLIASTVKTLFAPAAGFAEGLSFSTTFIATAIGGIIGFVFFYYFFDIIANRINKNKKTQITAKKLKKARRIVTMKHKYPVWLFVFILPFTSIPVMAVIIRKFFNHDKKVFALSIVAVMIFALIGCLMFSPIQAID
jgi:hypothetical protein